MGKASRWASVLGKKFHPLPGSNNALGIRDSRHRFPSMKHAMSALALGAFLSGIVGCGGESTSSTPQSYNAAISNNSSGNPLSAPVDYLGAVAKGKQSAVNSIDISQLKPAIQNFQITEDRFPASLDELVSKGYLRQIPAAPYGMKLQYDPKTGTVSMVKM
jgi:hypothetical protein